MNSEQQLDFIITQCSPPKDYVMQPKFMPKLRNIDKWIEGDDDLEFAYKEVVSPSLKFVRYHFYVVKGKTACLFFSEHDKHSATDGKYRAYLDSIGLKDIEVVKQDGVTQKQFYQLEMESL